MEWIPVNERLPEPGSWAIWCSVKGIIQVARWKEDAIDHFFPDQGFFQLEDAIAWMPLPQPYKADRKTENLSEKQTSSDEPQERSCDNCNQKHCFVCMAHRYYHYYWEPKTEPQTETEIARAIVHKMIDNTELAEDTYPDLRKRLHDAVDEYEPQMERPTNCSDCKEWHRCFEEKPAHNMIKSRCPFDEPQTDCPWK